MFKLHTLASVLIAGSLISAPVLAQQGKTFAKVNGQPISQNVFDAFIAGRPGRARNGINGAGLVSQTPARGRRGKQARSNSPVRACADPRSQRLRAQECPSDAQLKAEYDLVKKSLGGTEYKSRHILWKGRRRQGHHRQTRQQKNSPFWLNNRSTPAPRARRRARLEKS